MFHCARYYSSLVGEGRKEVWVVDRGCVIKVTGKRAFIRFQEVGELSLIFGSCLPHIVYTIHTYIPTECTDR